jgi:energy-converting hydrogenase Eha subunit A
LLEPIDPREWIIVGLFFLVYLLVGIKIYKDYGVSWDEDAQRKLGIYTISYVYGVDQKLLTLENRYHGQFFNFLKIRVEYWTVGNKNLQDAYFVDHLVNFLLFYTSVLVFFFFGRRRFRSWQAGLLGCAFLVLSPVIFSHSFYNPKDIPFLSFFIIAMYSLSLLEERPTLFRWVVHAIFSGAVIALRIPGIIIPVFTLGLLGVRQFLGSRQEGLSTGRFIAILGGYLVVTALVFISLYPISWHDPLNVFLDAFLHFQKFENWNDQMLFMGHFITAETTPWFYLPVWIGITTPLLYTFLFLSGTTRSARLLLKRPILPLDKAKRALLLDLGWFFVPLAIIIAGRSVVYDTWRHVFFVYPAFILLAVNGLRGWFSFLRRRWSPRLALAATGLACVVSFASTTYHIITTHPYENLYFNFLAGPNLAAVKQNYELDYWGLSFRAALEYLVKTDPSAQIIINGSNRAAQISAQILPEADQKRLVFLDYIDRSSYFVTNYKYHPQDYYFGAEIFSVKVNNVKIASVYRLK